MMKNSNKYCWLFGIWVILFRLPHIVLADNRLDGDSAHHWIVMDYMLHGKGFYLHPFGVNHVGLTEQALGLLFVPFFGHVQIAYQLSLCLIFLYYSYVLYKIANHHYGIKTARYTLLLLALPYPFIQFYSLRNYGGHMLSIAIILHAYNLMHQWNLLGKAEHSNIQLAKHVNRSIKKKIFVFGFLLGFAIYTSRIALLPAVSLSVLLALYVILNKKIYSVASYVFFFIGILAGLLPQFLGAFFQPIALHYAGGGFRLNTGQIWERFAVLLQYPTRALLDIVYAPGIEEAGFRPDTGVKNFIPIWQIIVLAISLPSISYFLQALYRNVKKRSIRNIQFTYGLFFVFVFFVNFLAVLLSDNKITVPATLMLTSQNVFLPITYRYFLPSMMVLPPLFALFLSREFALPEITFFNKYGHQFKSTLSRLYIIGHFSLYVFSYARGYLPDAPLYSKDASGGAGKVYNYLKSKKISYCIADFWVANNLIYYSRYAILASPAPGIPGMGLVKHPEFLKKILESPRGVECLVINPFVAKQLKIDHATKILELPPLIKGEKIKARIIGKKQIENWLIYHLEETPLSIKNRLNVQ